MYALWLQIVLPLYLDFVSIFILFLLPLDKECLQQKKWRFEK